MISLEPQPGCPPLPPSAGHLCVAPALDQDCLYDGSSGGTSWQSPLVVNCCCGRCDLDSICAHDSTTGSGIWQPMHSPLCPAEGCGSDGEWLRWIYS